MKCYLWRVFMMKKIIKYLIKIILIVCILVVIVGGTIFTISYVRFPASTLYKIGHTIYYETGMLLPDISLKSVEKEYSLIKNRNYENEQEYLEQTLTVCLKMFNKCFSDCKYDEALTYYEFAKSKIDDIDDINIYFEDRDKRTHIICCIADAWFCYMATEKQQELFDDYANSIVHRNEKAWAFLNANFGNSLKIDEDIGYGYVSFEKRKPYIIWFMNEVQKILDTTDTESITYARFSFIQDKMSEYMSKHQD